MSESPLRSRLSKRTLLISAGAVLGIAALIFGTAVAVGLTVPGVRAHFESLIIAVLLVPSTGTLIALAFTLRRRGHRLSAIGFPRPTARLFHLLWQVPASVIVVLGAQLLVFAVTGSEPVSDSSTDSIAGSVGPIAAISMFAAVGIITPLWEELFFRGVIYGFVCDHLGLKGAVPISTVVFALCHGVPILLPYMLALGLCLALLRTFHRNLWGPLGLHLESTRWRRWSFCRSPSTDVHPVGPHISGAVVAEHEAGLGMSDRGVREMLIYKCIQPGRMGRGDVHKQISLPRNLEDFESFWSLEQSGDDGVHLRPPDR